MRYSLVKSWPLSKKNQLYTLNMLYRMRKTVWPEQIIKNNLADVYRFLSDVPHGAEILVATPGVFVRGYHILSVRRTPNPSTRMDDYSLSTNNFDMVANCRVVGATPETMNIYTTYIPKNLHDLMLKVREYDECDYVLYNELKTAHSIFD